MSSLSDRTQALLSELIRPAPFFSFNKTKRKLQLLEQIADSGERDAAPSLLSFLLESHTHLAAAHAIARLLKDLPPNEVWNFRHVYAPIWNKMTPDRVQELADPEPDFVWALGFASVHRSGYVRQEAVRFLAKRPEPIALAFLIVRANDWVEEVRSLARAALIERAQEDVGAFAAFLPLLERLASCNRDAHRALVDDICDGLTRQTGLVSLQEAIKSTGGKNRRAAFKLALSSNNESAIALAKLGIEDQDLVVRIQSARKLIALPELLNIPRELRESRVISIRQLVIEKAVSMQPPDTALLKEYVLDRSSSIRSAARFYLSKFGFSDFASIYRNAISKGEGLEAAILGLGEIGSAPDFELVSKYLSNPNARYRTSAVFAFSKLAPVGNDTPLLAALADESASTSAAACLALIQRSSIVPVEQLMGLFKATNKDHVQKNIMRIFITLGVWMALASLLEAVPHAREGAKSLALTLIAKSLDRVERAYALPPPREEELRRVSDALAMAQSLPGLPIRRINTLLNIRSTEL